MSLAKVTSKVSHLTAWMPYVAFALRSVLQGCQSPRAWTVADRPNLPSKSIRLTVPAPAAVTGEERVD